ncbi:MAG: permease-like cell division protein FtsX [Jatrophihabitans sp.]
MRANFVLSGVWTGIRRNLSMTIALILNTAILLTFVATAVLANREIDKFSAAYEGKLNVSVFLCGKLSGPPCVTRPAPKGADASEQSARYTEAQRTALEAKLRADSRVVSIKFISEQRNYELARKTATARVRNLLQVGDLPASYTVKLKNINKEFESFAKDYNSAPGVSSVANQISTIRTLLDIIDSLLKASVAIAFFVLIAAVLLIANTIQVAAAQRKNETSIMRLVGASRWMTELPFIIEAIIATFIGGLVSLGLVSAGKFFLLNNVFAGQVENGVIPDLDLNDLIVACGVSVIGGIVLSALTAFGTLRLLVKL